MRRFKLQRNEDATGVSGIGVVAEGVQFTDGKVAIRWVTGKHRSTVVWESIDAVEAIHGHGGMTQIMWVDK